MTIILHAAMAWLGPLDTG